MDQKKVALLIPCYNEALTITKVISEARKHVPNAYIYVYDNNSTDTTVAIAKKLQVQVYKEYNQGKGNVVRRMFADVDADVYVMVDGDATYDLSYLPQMIEQLVENNLDMVVGARKPISQESFRFGHSFGNKLFNWTVRTLFGNAFKDIFSGYRVFSKRFVKSFPIHGKGFEIETEISVHALEMRLPVIEIATPYDKRPEGSHSKLNTYRDGFKVLCTIANLVKDLKPLLFFSVLSLLLATVGLIVSYPVIKTYLLTNMVPKFPTWILAVGIWLGALLCFVAGIILDSIKRIRLDNKKLAYLQYNV